MKHTFKGMKGMGNVAFVWTFNSINRDEPRADRVAALIKKGYNKNMVNTQTSWFEACDGDKDASDARNRAYNAARREKLRVVGE